MSLTGSSITFALPELIKDPTSFVHLNLDGKEYLCVSSMTGLHWMQLIGGDLVYLRQLADGYCSDVVVISDPNSNSVQMQDSEESAMAGNFMLAGLFRKVTDPNDTTASIVVFHCGKLISGGDVDVGLHLTCDRSWGRVLKMAFSPGMGRLYFSSRIDHQFGGEHQIGCVWSLAMSIPDITDCPQFSMAERLIRKKPGNIRHIDVLDERKVLAVCDLNDNSQFSVDLYDLSQSPPIRLLTISRGLAKGGWPIGSVYYPQGITFDSVGRLFVVDETRRVQRFSLPKNRVDAVVAKSQFDLPKKAIARGKKLFVIGCQYGRARIPKGGYLTVVYNACW